jgi:hypothetical protein
MKLCALAQWFAAEAGVSSTTMYSQRALLVVILRLHRGEIAAQNGDYVQLETNHTALVSPP